MSQPVPVGPADAMDPPQAAANIIKRRGWDDVTLRTKVTLLICLAGVWGAVIGIAFGLLIDGPIWMTLAAVGFLLLMLWSLADHWVFRPMESLLRKTARVCRPDRPLPASELPIDRFDEIGQLARALHRLSLTSRRDYSEARQLRRTFDQKVSQATQRATSQLMRLAMRDPLTNLGNRHFLDESAGALLDGCRQSQMELTCVMIDLDGFKQVNDTQGHFMGDELLRFVGGLLRSQVRHEDLAVRYGGDEFVLLLPGMMHHRLNDLLEYLDDLLEAHGRAVLPRDTKIGLSAGVAHLIQDRCQTLEQLIELADERLYAQKRRKKNAIQ